MSQHDLGCLITLNIAITCIGILGALIAIPAANIIRVLVREWMAYRQAKGTMDLPDAKSAPSHITWTRDQVEALD